MDRTLSEVGKIGQLVAIVGGCNRDHWIDFTASAKFPEPPPVRNFTGRILTFQATPATPIPLLPTAPMVPEQCVP